MRVREAYRHTVRSNDRSAGRISCYISVLSTIGFACGSDSSVHVYM